MPLTPSPKLGLCLSGGGFRATFFHLGVFKLLLDADLHGGVEEICSVSGGSILAAKLATDWSELNRPNNVSAFYWLALPLVKLAQKDLRGRIVRRSVLLGWLVPAFSRMRLLQGHYSALVGKQELQAMPVPTPGFHFLATSLTTGKLVAFDARGFHDGSNLHSSSHLPIALAVAASSAFPPLFPPLELTRDQLDVPAAKFPLEKDFLTDGGVIDNLGIVKMRELANEHSSKNNPLNGILISNASAPFDWAPTKTFARIITRTVRTTDVLMTRVSKLEQQQNVGITPATIELSIEEIVRPTDLSRLVSPVAKRFKVQDEEVQKLVSKIRTDLDEFSMEEICSLVRHGYEVAAKQLLLHGLLPTTFEPRDPCVVSFPDIGWPTRETIIANIRTLILGMDATRLGLDLGQKVNEVKHDLDAITGKPYFPDQDTDSDVREKVTDLRNHLHRSSTRGMRLWNGTDYFTWLWSLLILLLGAGAFLALIQISTKCPAC